MIKYSDVLLAVNYLTGATSLDGIALMQDPFACLHNPLQFFPNRLHNFGEILNVIIFYIGTPVLGKLYSERKSSFCASRVRDELSV